MIHLAKPVLAILFALSVAACAATPQPIADIQPPPQKRLDAKTALENHR